MAKTPKVKKREVSIYSRAARRKASPPPKDLAATAAKPSQESEYKPWLHNVQNGGVSKRTKTKTLTRQQRQRQQRGLEKADAVVAKLEKKVKDSKTRAKKIKGRAVDWDELNGKLEEPDAERKKVGSGVKDGDGTIEGVVVPDLELPFSGPNGEMLDTKEPQDDAVEKAAEGTAVPLPEPEDDEIL